MQRACSCILLTLANEGLSWAFSEGTGAVDAMAVKWRSDVGARLYGMRDTCRYAIEPNVVELYSRRSRFLHVVLWSEWARSIK